MAKAKCRQCGTFVNSGDAIKGTINGKNAFWCSEKCKTLYEEAQTKIAATNAEYDEIITITKEIFGYDFTSYSLLRKEINAWEKLTTLQNIISYLKENKEWLSRVMSKEFQGDYNRVRYFSAVISSKLYDYKPKKQEIIIPTIKEEHCVTKYKQKARKALLDFEEECYE
jgi:YHS domain-containing protein